MLITEKFLDVHMRSLFPMAMATYVEVQVQLRQKLVTYLHQALQWQWSWVNVQCISEVLRCVEHIADIECKCV